MNDRRLLLPRTTSAILAALVACCASAAARADTVASLLGNFTINQFVELRLTPASVDAHFVVVYGQLPALRELHRADADGDGVTTQAERDAHVAALAPTFTDGLKLTIDGVAVPLHAVRWKTSLPTEQGGFSLRIDIDYEAAAAIGDRPVAVRFENANYADRLGWHEIVVRPAPTVAAYDTGAFDDSLTQGLTEAVQALPAAGPLDERVVVLRAVAGTLPAGAVPIASRGARTAASAAASETSADPGEWLQRQTRRLVGIVSERQVAPSVLGAALLAALVLGAMHALSPGHGKTIVGAYLIGSRSTPRHAVFLGLTVTVTHTFVVFAIGLATLFASHAFVPERLFPILSLLSGLLVLGMGLVLLKRNWPDAHAALAHALLRWFEAGERRRRTPHGPDAAVSKPLRTLRPLPATAPTAYGLRRSALPLHRHPHATAHRHGAHDHGHGAAHSHAHDDPVDRTMHSHGGGPMHSHLPPGGSGEAVTWRSLLALGVSGGLVPCPSALVLLLAAIAINKTYYGLLMVVAFSVGLALTLITVGMAFLYARRRFGGRLGRSGLSRMLPAASGAFITLVGLVLCYAAVVSARTGPLAAAFRSAAQVAGL